MWPSRRLHLAHDVRPQGETRYTDQTPRACTMQRFSGVSCLNACMAGHKQYVRRSSPAAGPRTDDLLAGRPPDLRGSIGPPHPASSPCPTVRQPRSPHKDLCSAVHDLEATTHPAQAYLNFDRMQCTRHRSWHKYLRQTSDAQHLTGRSAVRAVFHLVISLVCMNSRVQESCILKI
jgi:hypothetical protein